MVERFAAYLSDFLIQTKTVSDKERPFLEYGLFCLLSGTIQIGLLLFISLLFHTIIQVAVFTFSFGILKRTIGGWHARHHSTCLVVFTTLVMACTWLGQWTPLEFVFPLSLLLAITMWLIVWLKAPVEHPNNPQSTDRLAELKRISRNLASSNAMGVITLAVLFHGIPDSRYPFHAAMGSFSAAFALLIRNQPFESKEGGLSK